MNTIIAGVAGIALGVVAGIAVGFPVWIIVLVAMGIGGGFAALTLP